MKSRTLLFMLTGLWMLAITTVPCEAARPDPSVAIELVSPSAGSRFMPGDPIEITLQVTDPMALVRRVFVRLVAPSGAQLNANQEAVRSGNTWKLTLKVPGSTRAGAYAIQVEAMGDETRLQWARLPIEVQAARFALKMITPAPQTVFSRNEDIDVVAQVDDPKRKTRRVFVELEEMSHHVVINANREADRKGDVWSQRVHIPPTATPGPYRITVKVFGEGLELLSSQRIPIAVTLAPVSVEDLRLEPSANIHPGETVRALARLDDPRNVIRHVLVTCTGPDGLQVVANVPAERHSNLWVRDISLDADCPPGTYQVEVQALGQGGESIRKSHLSFTVQAARR